MNKLQEINGKYYQECEVIMLATDAFLKVGMLNYEPYNSKDNKLELIHYILTGEGLNPQHLYLLSNEEIKDEMVLYDNLEDKIIDYRDQPASPKSILGRRYMSYCKKIIATTNQELDLPQPSKEFLQAFIKSYNENKPITKVLVEMKEYGEELDCDPAYYGLDSHRLKVNSSNEITIKKIKDSYTREETIELIKKFSNHFCPMNNHLEEDEDNWIEENL